MARTRRWTSVILIAASLAGCLSGPINGSQGPLAMPTHLVWRSGDVLGDAGVAVTLSNISLGAACRIELSLAGTVEKSGLISAAYIVRNGEIRVHGALSYGGLHGRLGETNIDPLLEPAWSALGSTTVRYNESLAFNPKEFARQEFNGTVTLAILATAVGPGRPGDKDTDAGFVRVECPPGIHVSLEASKEVTLAGFTDFDSPTHITVGFASVTRDGRIVRTFHEPMVQILGMTTGELPPPIGQDTLSIQHPEGLSTWRLAEDPTFHLEGGAGTYDFVLNRMGALQYEEVSDRCSLRVCLEYDYFDLAMVGWAPVEDFGDLANLPAFR